MRRLVLIALVSLVASVPAHAQARSLAGIRPDSGASYHRPSAALLDRTLASATQTAGVKSGWKWTTIGAVTGAIVVGAIGTRRQASRSGDPFLRQPVVRFGAVGAISGGLIGALAHAVTDRATSAMSPNDR